MILIIDVENTCLPQAETPDNYHYQIIEIGAVWVSEAGEVVDTFEVFVNAENPVSAYCTELTGITQQNVDTGLTYPEAMQALADFIARKPVQVWGSWGAADLKSLNHDCAHHAVNNPLQAWSHRNLKKEWAKSRRIKQVGMAKALEISGIHAEGPHHRALSDVLNIVKLLPGCA